MTKEMQDYMDALLSQTSEDESRTASEAYDEYLYNRWAEEGLMGPDEEMEF